MSSSLRSRCDAFSESSCPSSFTFSATIRASSSLRALGEMRGCQKKYGSFEDNRATSTALLRIMGLEVPALLRMIVLCQRAALRASEEEVSFEDGRAPLACLGEQ